MLGNVKFFMQRVCWPKNDIPGHNYSQMRGKICKCFDRGKKQLKDPEVLSSQNFFSYFLDETPLNSSSVSEISL